MLIHELIIAPATLAESEGIAIEQHNSKWDRSLALRDLAEIEYQPQRKSLNACDPFGLKESIMNLKGSKSKTSSQYLSVDSSEREVYFVAGQRYKEVTLDLC